ncbi:hypothetical protein CGK56_25290 [Vibrio parahaemolyticus]|nr:hypothetical protein CGK56_25290 [Vibrio parahaemolyticus]
MEVNLKKLRVIYYDTNKDTGNKFKEKHDGNKKLDIKVLHSISDVIHEIDNNDIVPIDLILVDLFSELPEYKLKCNNHSSYYSVLDSSDKKPSDKFLTNELVEEFQNNKDYLNIEIDKVWDRDGLNVVETIFSHFECHDIYNIPVAIYSMLGRRLISSKQASRLQSKGVMWVWKSKENIINKTQDRECNDYDLNCEFDSIYNAIMAYKLRNKRILDVKKDFDITMFVQALTILVLFVSLYFNFKDDGIKSVVELLGFMISAIVIVFSALSTIQTKKKIHKL